MSGYQPDGRFADVETAVRLISMSRANENRRTVPMPLPESPATSLNLSEIASAHRTNKFLALDDVVEARLHRGILTDRLALRMRDGRHHKLLWLKVDPAHEILDQALDVPLGHRLRRD